jgi:hypothetical protein
MNRYPSDSTDAVMTYCSVYLIKFYYVYDCGDPNRVMTKK